MQNNESNRLTGEITINFDTYGSKEELLRFD